LVAAVEVQWFLGLDINNSSAFIIEDPFLRLVAISGLGHNVVTNDIEIPTTGHLWDDWELFTDVHSPFSYPFSIFWWSFESVKVDNIPLLTKGIVSFEYDNVICFYVSVAWNLNSSTIFDVDNSSVIIFEKLEPSGIGGPDLKVAGTSTVLDINGMSVLSDWFDGLCLWVKEPDLIVISSIVGFGDDVSLTNNSENSLHRHSWSDDESSSKMDLVWSIESSSLLIFGLVNICDGPFLAELIGDLCNLNVGTFVVLATSDLDNSWWIFDDLQVALRKLELLVPNILTLLKCQVATASIACNV
jgi:hypothetical protein